MTTREKNLQLHTQLFTTAGPLAGYNKKTGSDYLRTGIYVSLLLKEQEGWGLAGRHSYYFTSFKS